MCIFEVISSFQHTKQKILLTIKKSKKKVENTLRLHLGISDYSLSTKAIKQNDRYFVANQKKK